MSAITTVEETRTIKTEKHADGSVTRTETIVTKAVNEKALDVHLAFARPPAAQRDKSLWEEMFGRPFGVG